ncbi:MAG: methionine gamma-lyase family protein [Candidatus Melainabacteria bacterium]|nr:methionine gamma-lyase family protein [Candidatus Melainabacteria bacterium]
MADALKVILQAERELAAAFEEVDRIALENQERVLSAFRKNRICEEHFAERTGYGIDDYGREVIDQVFADVFGCEAACVRMQMVSGTHAIACALFGNLRPGDKMVSLTGKPYDTLNKVIGANGYSSGSLTDLGVNYVETDLIEFTALDTMPDALSDSQLGEAIARVAPAKLFHIQKSRGYSTSRPTLSNAAIARLCRVVKEIDKEAIVFVDNCYGEFVEESEPVSMGADLMAGSLIKNPGGGLALTGGYVAGRRDLVDNALIRLTAPGIGGHLGVTFNQNRLVLQGLFLAPSVVSGAVKGAMLFAQALAKVGLKVDPSGPSKRYDIIQAIEFGKREALIDFCRVLQSYSPVNAHVAPEPSEMPGYEDQVIMAGGSFIEGATIELSADGPLREPYAAYLQGGLSYLHVKTALRGVLSNCKVD